MAAPARRLVLNVFTLRVLAWLIRPKLVEHRLAVDVEVRHEQARRQPALDLVKSEVLELRIAAWAMDRAITARLDDLARDTRAVEQLPSAKVIYRYVNTLIPRVGSIIF